MHAYLKFSRYANFILHYDQHQLILLTDYGHSKLLHFDCETFAKQFASELKVNQLFLNVSLGSFCFMNHFLLMDFECQVFNSLLQD
jgi:hypothetical protein